MDYSFTRYLAAKKTVDDRSLNERVWRAFWEICPASSRYRPLEILELGAGTGAMIERFREKGMLTYASYTALDIDGDNIAVLQAKKEEWDHAAPHFQVMPVQENLYEFVAANGEENLWDALVAHAFLDLFDLSQTLPALFNLLDENGVFYFTINFDGETILEPPLDPGFDEQVIDLYHRTMDERVSDGRPAGSSHTGRKLIPLLNHLGLEVVAAGGSDWVVYPQNGRYPADEAYFLHHILYFFEQSLRGRPELDQVRFAAWLAGRRQQIERGELVYIAHQLDVTGRRIGAV